MRKSTTALLLISLVISVSCGSRRVDRSGWARSGVSSVFNTYFSDAARDYVYRTKINVYGNELNGILIAKKIGDSTHRVVLTTDFGNTLLDFEVGQDNFKVNSIVEDLDRKIIVNTLRDDFRLLFRERYDGANTFNNNGGTVYEVSDDTGRYRILATDGRINAIGRGSERKDKVNATFKSENNTFADEIIIEHFDLKLVIEMNRFVQ